MDSTELPHLFFRWIHVLAGVTWVGQLWSLTLVHRLTPGTTTEPVLKTLALRSYKWGLWSARVTWLTGFPLLGIVYYTGGAVAPGQSLGLATAVGLASLFVGSIVYDAVWVLLGRNQVVATVVSLVLLTAAAGALMRFMVGRAVFIHLGAMLATIMVTNMERRIAPVERRLLAATPQQEQPSAALIEVAALRLRHNAVLAVAVILFMISNHFPLVYGNTRGWLLAPGIVVIGWAATKLFEKKS